MDQQSGILDFFKIYFYDLFILFLFIFGILDI